jgi:hypothetical protein
MDRLVTSGLNRLVGRGTTFWTISSRMIRTCGLIRSTPTRKARARRSSGSRTCSASSFSLGFATGKGFTSIAPSRHSNTNTSISCSRGRSIETSSRSCCRRCCGSRYPSEPAGVTRTQMPENALSGPKLHSIPGICRAVCTQIQDKPMQARKRVSSLYLYPGQTSAETSSRLYAQ